MPIYVVNVTEPDGKETRVQLGCAEGAYDFLAWLAFDGRKGRIARPEALPERSPEELARAMALMWRYASVTGHEFKAMPKFGDPIGEQE